MMRGWSISRTSGVLIRGLARSTARFSPVRSAGDAGASKKKLRILAQSVAPGSSPSLVCRLHGISSGQLYTWRRQFRSGELTGFAPVRLAPPVEELARAAASVDPVLTLPETDRPADGIIEVELPSGVKLRLTGAVDELALRRVLSALS